MGDGTKDNCNKPKLIIRNMKNSQIKGCECLGGSTFVTATQGLLVIGCNED